MSADTIEQEMGLMSRRFKEYVWAKDNGGYEVTIGFDRSHTNYELMSEVDTWIKENCEGDSIRFGVAVVFERETDALLFTLHWA